MIVGIIPARAGFTGRPALARGAVRDHPRSRGVYTNPDIDDAELEGSSPLARGLREGLTAGIVVVGIIPARAGFTIRKENRNEHHRDHPRSRGVYCGCRYLRVVTPRIIPARAGFTHPPGRGPHCHPDHPRSRGVYTTASVHLRVYAGSSPLARGLRSTTPGGGPERRIIPARAGFTRRGTSAPPGRADHPRSRGVYLLVHLRVERGAGSSPLARGLHTLSRLAVSAGSSPLARGLHADGGHVPGRDRIIPARAGFTAKPRRRALKRADHPRSRGVYVCECCDADLFDGSSPLARGLPRQRMVQEQDGRIIPARAGFTNESSPSSAR